MVDSRRGYDARPETVRSLRTVAGGHAFVQNLRRGHHELSAQVP